MSAGRGRGFAMSAAQDTELRRPGEAGLKQRFGSPPVSNGQASESNKVSENPYAELCNKMGQINMSTLEEELPVCATQIKTLCDTTEKFEKCVDDIFQFALKSKWNAHAVAIFCNKHGDIQVEQLKFRNVILRKLQQQYKERVKAYLEKEKFLMDATFSCEIFYHVLVGGVCLTKLAPPIIDYLGMLVDGASEKEVEVFVEQFPKCYAHLKANDPAGIDTLIGKMRKQIVSQSTPIPARAMLLEIFELVLTEWKPLNETARHFYESLSKPIENSFPCFEHS
ncbi:unnamed protein product [Larinioides sclopetarius]|uniref:MIF4G domain-containing protein n=1 Tax=Larinioides sclopetarius TaxID=280406 RepID=A0AAV2BLN6_9ARAC